MPFAKLIFVFLFACIGISQTAAFALENENFLPPAEAFKVTAKALSADKLEVSWAIAEGYSVYRNNLRFQSRTTDVELGQPDFPAGKVKHDELLGDIEHYHNRLDVQVPVTGATGMASMQLFVQYQACADRGICYPPQKTTLAVDLSAMKPETVSASFNPLEKLVKATGFSFNAKQSELLPPDQAFQFFAEVKDANTLHVNWKIAENYYLYREKVQLELVNAGAVQLGPYSVPHGTPKHDEAFGQVEIFHGQLAFDVPLVRSSADAQAISIKAGFQGCADRGVCYPPMDKTIGLALPEASGITINANQTDGAISEQDQIVKSLHKDSLWATLLSFFGFGFLLSLTPCIFPMIPILSGIIVGHKHISTSRAFLLSLSYVLASALTYTAFGILAALFGENLQATFQQPWIIALFSAVFVLLSLSMFGFYHLELPKSLQVKLHNSSERHRDGSLLGAAIMGSLSSLIVGPCVAAPLAGALIYIGQTGDALLGGSALFAMGLGMGVPLLLLGASAGKLLPKAGDWLNATKAVFGVIMLAVAVWMLSRIIPPAVAMLLYAMLLILPSIYLKAIDPLPEHSSGWQKLWKGIGLMMLVYGLLLLIGIGMGNSNPLQPLQGASISRAEANKEAGTELNFQAIASVAELDAKIGMAAKANQPVMLDFYADWCISCKEMEAYTFTDPEVKRRLSKFLLLRADITKNTMDDQALLAKFNLVGPPAVLFFSDGQEQAAQRVIGYQDSPTFLQTLNKVAP